MKKFREVYDEDYNPNDYATDLGDMPSMTKQAFADECDINNIINRYLAGGDISHLMTRIPVFGDFSNVPDFSSMMSTIVGAQEAFEQLPSRIRERFGNDPAALIDFLSNPDNRSEAESFGLVVKPVKEVSVPSEVKSEA